MRLVEPSATLLSITPNAAQLIERAGRVCYKSENKITDKSADKFIQNLKHRHHMSVLEHASATFHLVTERGTTHELVRHRLASYSQESTRYCAYKDDVTFIRPLNHLFEDAYKHAEIYYHTLLRQGIPAQEARAVLPIGLKTEIVVTANFREWMHIFDLRINDKAHPNIRHLMIKVQEILQQECPEVFS